MARKKTSKKRAPKRGKKKAARKLARRVVKRAIGTPRAKPGRFIRVTPKRLDERMRAIDVAEKAKESVERGAHKYHLGSTGWITPTKQGLSHVTKMIRSLSNRKLGEKDIYSFGLRITFNDKSGKVINKELPNVGIPPVSELKKRYPDMTKHEAFNRWVRRTITRKIFEGFADHFPYPASVLKHKVGAKQAEKMIQRVREQRDARFSFTFYRDTT